MTIPFIITEESRNNFYAYNSETNQWTQKASFAGTVRTLAVGFAVNGKGYIGTGAGEYADGNASGALNDFYEYDPASDSWAALQNPYPGARRWGAAAFTHNDTAYVLDGFNIPSNSAAIQDCYPHDFYSFDGLHWKQLAPINSDIAHAYGVAFVTGDKAYLTGGSNANISSPNTTWEYDIENDTWRAVAPFIGNYTFGCVAFALGNQGYVGTGAQFSNNQNSNLSSAFYQFTPAQE